MTYSDRYGLPITTTSGAARECYVEGVDRLLALDIGAEEALEAAVEADDGLAMAHAALAFLRQFLGRPQAARLAAQLATSRAVVASRRERQHIGALAAAITADPGALDLVNEHLDAFPRDALVLYQAMFLVSFGGGPQPKERTFRLYERLAPAYGNDWWFLGSFSFASHELGLIAEAWPMAERSLALNPRNGSAVHSLTHLYYETGEHSDGLDFLDKWLRGYDREAPYHTHFSWHRALHHLAMDQVDDVMDIYRRDMSPAISSASTTLVDSASLLWRVELYDCDVYPLPWAEVSRMASRLCPEAGHAFTDVHAALAHCGAGDDNALGALIDGLRTLKRDGHLTAGSIVLPLVQGLIAFVSEDYEAASTLIESVAGEIVRVGGSHAQREVFEDTLLVAYLRSGRYEAAEALLRERMDRRPSGRDRRWLQAAESRGAD